MLVFKYISCVIAILATTFYVSEIITVLKAGSDLFLPWREGSEVTGLEVHNRVRRIASVILAIFWSIVIVF